MDPLSNRHLNVQKLVTHVGVIDTIVVRGPVSGSSPTKVFETLCIDDVTGEEVRRRTKGVSSLVFSSGHTAELTVRADEARLEVSIPSAVRGHNVVAATATEAAAVLEEAFHLAGEYVTWECAWRDLHVSRLDLVRDFTGVSDPSTLISVLSGHRPSRTSGTTRYTQVGAHQTLVHEVPRRWRASLYDKAAEVADHSGSAPEEVVMAAGRLRFEAQLRRPALKGRHVHTAEDLDQGALTYIAKAWFDRCRFGSPIRHRAGFRERYNAYPGPKKELRDIDWVLRCRHEGLDDGQSRTTRAKYLALAEKHGLTWPSVETQGAGVRLDFNSARLVGL